MQSVELADGRSCRYRIQESERVRRIRLRLSASEGMVVIVPAGMTPHQEDLERLIRNKSRWISRHLHRFTSLGSDLRGTDFALPGVINLPAISERWEVVYAAPDPNQAPASTRVRVSAQGVLHVCGPESLSATDRTRALRGWVRAKAAAVLPVWLDQLAREMRMPFSRVTIRDQRTRWGSCSRQGRINLNCKLLFLPLPWTRYVLVHELCHTRIMNHGKEFWALVARYESQSRRIRTEMRSAWKKLPAWMTTR